MSDEIVFPTPLGGAEHLNYTSLIDLSAIQENKAKAIAAVQAGADALKALKNELGSIFDPHVNHARGVLEGTASSLEMVVRELKGAG